MSTSCCRCSIWRARSSTQRRSHSRTPRAEWRAHPASSALAALRDRRSHAEETPRMELTSSRTVPASVETTWAALNDAETLKACIPGCESIVFFLMIELKLTITLFLYTMLFNLVHVRLF